MAFWGVEVKPKKPFTLTFSDYEAPTLRLSQATLGKSKSDERIIVGCSVNDSPVVYICSLLPGTFETCSLNLCFDGDVTFSVRGSSTVHLAGYFDGTFDGDESGEDVEEDDYSDEDEEEGSEDESLDGFIVSGDEDTYDDDEEWSNEEDVFPNTRKSGVTIEELHDEPLAAVSKEGESQEGSLIPYVLKHAVFKETTDSDGNVKQLSENLGTVANLDDKHKRSEDKHMSSSEDEDGFRVKRKRIHKRDDDEQPPKKMATNTGAEVLQPGISPVSEEMDADSRGSAKKKKKKKKKKNGNKDLPDADNSDNPAGKQVREEVRESGHDDPQQLTETVHKSSQHDDNTKKAKPKSRGADVAVVSSKENKINKKGTSRKYPNGLEVENISMGKADGKQATPGKKVEY